MFVDALCLLSDSQAITVDAVSTNKYDLSAVDRSIGQGEPMAIQVTVEVAADFTTTDETYIFEVVVDDDANLGSPTIIAAYTRTAAQLIAGSKHVFPIPPVEITERYLGMNYNVGGTTPTITVSAAVMPLKMCEPDMVNYPDAVTIS